MLQVYVQPTEESTTAVNVKTLGKAINPPMNIKSFFVRKENKTEPSFLKTTKGGGKIYENSRAKSCSSTGKSEQGQGVTDIRAFLAEKKLEREQKVLLGNNLGVTGILASSEQTRGCSGVFFGINSTTRSLAETVIQNGFLINSIVDQN